MSTTEKPIVLIVDDDKRVRDLVKIHFELGGYVVEMAPTIKGAMNLIFTRRKKPEIIAALIDWKMREAEASPLFRWIRENARHSVLASAYTADGSNYTHHRARSAGAKHFFIKDLPLDLIQGYIDEDFEEVKDYAYDDMTKLLNVKGFRQAALADLATAKERPELPYPEAMSMLYIDLNKFKSINDAYGHNMGDRAIKVVADALRKHIRTKMDLLCRIYGDEFGILLPLDAAQAETKAKELEVEVRAITLFTDDSKLIPLSISVGVAELRRSEIGRDVEQTLDELINLADERMRARKEAAGEAR